jgi:hypothetical protein
MTQDIFSGPLVDTSGAKQDIPTDDPVKFGNKHGFDMADIEAMIAHYGGDKTLAIEWMSLILKAKLDGGIVVAPMHHCPPNHTGLIYPDGRVIYTEYDSQVATIQELPKCQDNQTTTDLSKADQSQDPVVANIPLDAGDVDTQIATEQTPSEITGVSTATVGTVTHVGSRTVMEMAKERALKMTKILTPLQGSASVVSNPPWRQDQEVSLQEDGQGQELASHTSVQDAHTLTQSTSPGSKNLAVASVVQEQNTNTKTSDEMALTQDKYYPQLKNKEKWVPQTEDDWDWVANLFAELESEQFRVDQQYKRRCASIAERRRFLEWKYLDALKAWTTKNLPKNKRYIDLPSARLKFRKVAAHWKIGDEDLLRGWAAKLPAQVQNVLGIFSVTLWKWNDIKLIKQFADQLKTRQQPTPPGLAWIDEAETFKIEATSLDGDDD